MIKISPTHSIDGASWIIVLIFLAQSFSFDNKITNIFNLIYFIFYSVFVSIEVSHKNLRAPKATSVALRLGVTLLPHTREVTQ